MQPILLELHWILVDRHRVHEGSEDGDSGGEVGCWSWKLKQGCGKVLAVVVAMREACLNKEIGVSVFFVIDRLWVLCNLEARLHKLKDPCLIDIEYLYLIF